MNILITGASKGVGFALTKLFLENDDHSVFVISRDTRTLKNLAAKIDSNKSSGNLIIYGFDLQSERYDELFAEVKRSLGCIDILINNAGALINKPFEQLTDEDFDLLFNVNMKSPFRLIRSLLPLYNKPAHIINITSMGAVQGSVKFPGLSLYSSSKGALSILTECLAEELKSSRVNVNALALGAVQTEMLSEAFPDYKAPLEPDEMAKFIKDFALNGHQYFNGKILPVSTSTP